MEIHKKIDVDEQGTPQEVIIPWAEFQKIQELLELDSEIQLSPEWEAEIARRIDDIDSGRAELRSSEEVFNRLRSKLLQN
jgi:putative addiction module component (TIGR02574 family)